MDENFLKMVQEGETHIFIFIMNNVIIVIIIITVISYRRSSSTNRSSNSNNGNNISSVITATVTIVNSMRRNKREVGEGEEDLQDEEYGEESHCLPVFISRKKMIVEPYDMSSDGESEISNFLLLVDILFQ